MSNLYKMINSSHGKGSLPSLASDLTPYKRILGAEGQVIPWEVEFPMLSSLADKVLTQLQSPDDISGIPKAILSYFGLEFMEHLKTKFSTVQPISDFVPFPQVAPIRYEFTNDNGRVLVWNGKDAQTTLPFLYLIGDGVHSQWLLSTPIMRRLSSNLSVGRDVVIDMVGRNNYISQLLIIPRDWLEVGGKESLYDLMQSKRRLLLVVSKTRAEILDISKKVSEEIITRNKKAQTKSK